MIPLEDDQQALPVNMEEFLAQIEKKAYRMARIALGGHHDALDILQDSMIKLVTHYQQAPAEQWKPLFYRILQNRIRDWHRQQKVKNLIFFWRACESQDNEWPPAVDSCNSPDAHIASAQLEEKLVAQLAALPLKQQQCFMLRSWEGLSVADTAAAMGCSQGSVKTHYFRAITKLKTALEAHNDVD